jgi:hypothetical protein
MSTLTEARENLDQLEQDAAAFRYLLAHPMSGVSVIEDTYAECEAEPRGSRAMDAAIRERFRALIAKKARRAER